MGSVAGGYVHDLNNLLLIVMSEAAAAEEDLPPGHPSRESLADIQRASRAAAAIARRMLDFVRHQESQRRTLDLRRLIQEYLPLGARLVGGQIAITAILEPTLWPIQADPVQIEQLLLNLLVNARDAMPGGGAVTIRAANMPAGRAQPGRPGDAICLEVIDTGEGISPEVAGRLFEPFVSGRASAGTGLGLATCHCIVCQLGGTIEAESVPGRGATFRIYLPRSADAEGSGPLQPAP